jgi:hypothetical protein
VSQVTLTEPLDLLRFVAIENEQFMVSLTNNRNELAVLSHLHGLYSAAMSGRTVHENDFAIFQMLTFAHYHFLFSTASLMRCHLSEAFASARAAIDGALIGAQIIHDRASQIAYTRREKPFDNFARYLGNLIKDGKPLPHPLVGVLFDLHKTYSTFSTHADIGSFVHRVRLPEGDEPKILSVQYFQFSQDPIEREIHAFTLFHVFVLILDVFSDFLVGEKGFLTEEWRAELHGLGKSIERHHAKLKGHVGASGDDTPDLTPRFTMDAS